MDDENMMEFLLGLLITLVIAGIISLAIYNGIFFIQATLDHSTCIATVDSKEVYRGKCHFITLEPVGQYGNTKLLTIYKGVSCIIPYKKYTSENIVLAPAN